VQPFSVPRKTSFSSAGFVMNRISRVALILCACFVSVAWAQQPAGTCSNNWSEFLRPNMERCNPCEKVLNVNNVRNLTLKWSYTASSSTFSSPALVDGVIYVGSQADKGNKVYALKAGTGAELWSYPTGGYVDSSLAVSDGVVYVGSNDHNVYALNARTGALLWSFTTDDFVESSPAVANGVVYVGGDYPDDSVYALMPTPAHCCGDTRLATSSHHRPRWRMGWSLLARGTRTYTR
jgi:glucose dehydrogenase